MVIKTIFFDFGGVIIKTPNLHQLNRWKKFLGLANEPEIVEMLANPYESQLVKDICLGKITEDHLWVLMAEKWHIKPKFIRTVRRRLFSKRQLNKPIVQLMAELHKNYQTAILSNAGDQTRRVLEDVYHLDRYVDDIIISAEEGVIKPDPQIYQIAMARLATTPEISLFLDDYLGNVEAAREVGMRAVQFINNHQAIQMIRNCLNEED
jgi:epoxide hydrolase-like predicted phosphatase